MNGAPIGNNYAFRHGHSTRTHGVSPTYISWANMLGRCASNHKVHFAKYKARGITVCNRWHKFANFLKDMGERPDGMSLDRFPNNSGNYEPGNCRWATDREQMLNRRITHWITFNGRTLCMSDWAKELGLNISTLSMRINIYKWPLEKSLKRKKS